MTSEPRSSSSTTNVGSTWAGSWDYRAAHLVTPSSIEALQDLVARTPRIRPLGSRHSFTSLADTTGVLVSLRDIPHDLVIDEVNETVTFSAGMLYGEVAAALEAHGWAIHNMASLPHISVAGAVATGTHGSGDRNGTLSSAVAAVDMVRPSGELVRVARGDADFDGSVVALGALGVVSRISLDIEPRFEMRQDVYNSVPWSAILADPSAITSSAYSVSIFTLWGDDAADSVWLKSRLDEPAPPAELSGIAPLKYDRHMLPGVDPVNTTTQGGVAGAWNDRLAHFKLGFTPSNGNELQSEYLLPRSAFVEAISAMHSLGNEINHLLYNCEVRTMTADSLWLSGAHGRDTVGIHFTWKAQPDAVAGVIPLIENLLLPLGGRPHWGKVFAATSAELAPMYERMSDFRALVDRIDPAGKFSNDFLRERVLG